MWRGGRQCPLVKVVVLLTYRVKLEVSCVCLVVLYKISIPGNDGQLQVVMLSNQDIRF